MCERTPLSTANDILCVFSLAFEQHVGLADCIGLRVDFLTVE